MESLKKEWNPEQNLTAALPGSIGLTKLDFKEDLLDMEGPSKSVQVLIYMKEKGVLMAEDWDYRKNRKGELRVTFKSLKASFGFGLSGEGVVNVWSVVTDATKPPNRSLYGKLSTYFDKLSPCSFLYSERGDGWGPAVTVPVVLDFSEEIANKMVEDFNTGSLETILEKGEESPASRFRNFRWVPMYKLLKTGNDDPAVLDGTKLVSVNLDGVSYNLWDENQMRKHLLPTLNF